jgi:hypothetical protein
MKGAFGSKTAPGKRRYYMAGHCDHHAIETHKVHDEQHLGSNFTKQHSKWDPD